MDQSRFEQAVSAHARVIKRLLDYLDGSEQAHEPLTHPPDTCELGRWLSNQTEAIDAPVDYQRAKELHNRFHDLLAEIVALIEQGNRGAALARLKAGSEFPRVSRELIIAIDDLTAQHRPHGGSG